ncbi:MAG: ABC transporter ATP-binding protein [Spirochaetia bacterium]|nr:ABC transporter ATP-binding protein [Spirochaetia bacterium]
MLMIEIKNLTKEYRGESDTVQVLSGLDFEVPAGEIVSVEGASGEGKSTLLNILGTIDSVTSGKILIGQENIVTMSDRDKEKFRANTLGFIFQHHYLLPDFTVLENATMPLLIQRKSILQARNEAEEMLEKVGLSHRFDHYPSQISGGEMARAGVARALVGGKTLILADEPTGNLDRKNSDKLADLLWNLQDDLKFTLLIVTHDQDLAARVPDRYRLMQGKLNKIS